MKGLPPWPSDVLQVFYVHDVDGHELAVQHSVFVPGLQELAVDELESIAGFFVLAWSPLVGNNSHSGCRFVRVDLRRLGSDPLRIERVPATAGGRWSGGQMLAACATLHWLNSDSRSSIAAVTHMPGLPDVYVRGSRLLSDLGYGNLSTDAPSYLANINATTSPAGGQCVLATVHRSRGGEPLSASSWSPVIGVRPGVRIGVLARRKLIGSQRSS